MAAQRIGDARTPPEVYWSGVAQNEDELSLRIVKRHGDSWLQAWNVTVGKQLFQFRDVSPGGIEFARTLCKDYAAGTADKTQLEIRKRTHMKSLAVKEPPTMKRPAAKAHGTPKKKAKTKKARKPVSISETSAKDKDHEEGGEEAEESEEEAEEPTEEETILKVKLKPAAATKAPDKTAPSISTTPTLRKRPAAATSLSSSTDKTAPSLSTVVAALPELPEFLFDY